MLSEMKWMPVVFFGCLSFCAFLSHQVVLSNYRSEYDAMISSKQQRLVWESNNNNSYWFSYSMMLVGCSVMLGYFLISILGLKYIKKYAKDLIKVSVVPFLIWFISSLAWLGTNIAY